MLATVPCLWQFVKERYSIETKYRTETLGHIERIDSLLILAQCRVTEESDQLSDLDMDPNCRALAISSDDGSCKLWSLTDGKLLETLKKPGIFWQ